MQPTPPYTRGTLSPQLYIRPTSHTTHTRILTCRPPIAVQSLDLWTAFQSVPGWQDGLLDDGLHLTQAGNQQVASLLLGLIEKEFPHLGWVRESREGGGMGFWGGLYVDGACDVENVSSAEGMDGKQGAAAS